MDGDKTSDDLLERVVHLDTLRWAWRRVRENAGAAGGDGISLRRFATLLETNLLTLADDVRAGTYQPGAWRRVTVYHNGKARHLAILPVRDRVLQRAVIEILVPRIEPSFLACSFGYRPGRSLQDAVERIVSLRDHGLTWVVDADVHDCFGNLDHTLLGGFLADLIPDLRLRALLDLWIGPPRPARPRHVVPGRGIPQGAVISPLLCNIYLHHLDASLLRRRVQSIRYADDFVVLCKSEFQAERALRMTEKVLAGLKLELNWAKTRIVSFDEGFDYLGVHFKGADYSYLYEDKRIVVDELPPEWFYYVAEGYE